MPPTFATYDGQVIGVMAGDAVAKAKEGAEDITSDGFDRMQKLHLAETDIVVGLRPVDELHTYWEQCITLER